MGKCGEKTEVYSRVTGYFRPVANWNPGKVSEFNDRKMFKVDESAVEKLRVADEDVLCDRCSGLIKKGETCLVAFAGESAAFFHLDCRKAGTAPESASPPAAAAEPASGETTEETPDGRD